MMISAQQNKAINNILFNCGNLTAQDQVLILCDPSTRDLAEASSTHAKQAKPLTVVMEIPVLPHHGSEPPP